MVREQVRVREHDEVDVAIGLVPVGGRVCRLVLRVVAESGGAPSGKALRAGPETRAASVKRSPSGA